MQNLTKLKIGLFSATLLVAVGTAAYQVHTWSESYNKIEQKQIQNFDTLWSTIWDNKNKTFTPKLDKNIVQQLDTLAETPSQKEKLALAKTSVDLVFVKNHNSTLSQYVAAANNYYQFEKNDNNYQEQQTFNTNTIAEIENLINSVNANIDMLLITNNTIDFDKTTTTTFQLNPISTTLQWSDLTLFNTHVNNINTLIQIQVQENNNKIKQEDIIQLKSTLDEFVALAKQYEHNINTDYITIKDLKLILSSLSNIDVLKHQNWFTTIKSFDDTNILNYKTSFSTKFFTDNSDLQKYQNQLSQIDIFVNFTRTSSNVTKKSDEKHEQTFNYSLNTSTSQTESDLININSLQNISIEITQTQTIKIYVEETPPSSTSTTTSSNTETTTSSTTPIPIRRNDQ